MRPKGDIQALYKFVRILIANFWKNRLSSQERCIL